MSYLDRTHHIRKFGGTVYYVSKLGNDSNLGTGPTEALLTIGEAISKLSVGDAINIMAGAYTEIGLDLNVNGCEMWFEIGTILNPASGTALTISGHYCRVTCEGGALKITPATNATGVLVTGNFCYLNEIRVACFNTDEATSADIGFDITGSGADLRRCRVSSPDVVAFKIQGDTCKLDNCCTGGGSDGTAFSSIGYWVTNNADKTRLIYCGSQGHGTSGFQIDSGCTNGVLKDCNSGGGDGRWADTDHSAVWSDFTFDNEIYKEITFSGSPTTYNVFKVTGAVKITNIYGHVETVIANTTSAIHLELYSTNGTGDLTNNVGAPDVDTLAVGSLIIKKGDSSDALEMCSSAAPCLVEYGTKDPDVAFLVTSDAAEDTFIRLNITAPLASGALHWHCRYEPLTENGFLSPV